MAAAVAGAGGNDALTAGLAAGGSEAAVPIVSKYWFGKKPSDLTADEKGTISAIVGLAGAGIGATTGDVASTVQSGQLSQNAVENNNTAFMSNPLEFEELKQPKTREEILLEAHAQKEQALYMALALNVVKDFILYRNLGGKYEVRDKVTGKAIATFDNAKDAQKSIDFAKLKVEQSKQNKHISGTNEYKVAQTNGQQKSILNNNLDTQKLVNEYAGKGRIIPNKIPLGQPGSKEVVSSNQIIGKYYDPKTQEFLPTKNFTIHYSKNGVHIVPSRP